LRPPFPSTARAKDNAPAVTATPIPESVPYAEDGVAREASSPDILKGAAGSYGLYKGLCWAAASE